MASNNTNKSNRIREVWDKSNGVCAHCGKEVPKNMQTVDHFIPKAHGGGFDRRNLMPLCKKCNMRRNDKPVNPYAYYPYASADAIKGCMAYKRKWREEHSNMAGDLFV